MKIRILPLLALPFFVTAQPETTPFKRSEVESSLSAEGARVDRFSLYSPSMDREIKVVVVLPPAYLKEGDHAEYPVLYTLHGYGAPYDTFARMPKLRNVLQDKPFIYTCFDGDVGSYYIDSVNPILTARKKEAAENPEPELSKFETFFFEEFIPAIDHYYRVRKNARGVTGFSMGGSGAMGYMLARPGLFCSVSGLSTAFLDGKHPRPGIYNQLPGMLGGTKEEVPERYEAIDHYIQMEKHLAAGTELPPIYQHIGDKDFLLEENHRFKKFAEEKKLDLTYLETPGGHNWQFWHPASVGVAEFHWEHFQAAADGEK